MLVLAMVPTVAFAADPWPNAEGGVITLEADKTYGGIDITEEVTIIGNGATVSSISIKTADPVVIKGVNFENWVYLEHAVEVEGRYQFDVTIEDCVFGTPGGSVPYRRIYMPENNKPQEGYMTVKNCTFYEATYCVNLLSVTNIHFEGNTFNSDARPALQYIVTAENKDNIKIFNNVFNGTGNGLMVTIADGSFDADAHIGNVYNNTFNGTRVVVAVSDPDVETLTVLRNNGLNASNIWFSSWSLNPRFKPVTTGPLSGEMLKNLNFANGTEVTADVDPSFIITIPASVNFGTLTPGTGTVTQNFNVTASNVMLEAGSEISVKVTSDFKMTAAGDAELPYGLRNSTAYLTSGDEFASFTGNRTEYGYVYLSRANIKNAGNYKGTMTFTISYE